MHWVGGVPVWLLVFSFTKFLRFIICEPSGFSVSVSVVPRGTVSGASWAEMVTRVVS